MTRAEIKLWKRLKTGQIRGFDFDRQHMAGEWILDFYCKRLRLAIELDGEVHAHLREKDQRRQRALEAMGIRFLGFWNAEVMNYSDAVVAKIAAWISEHEHEAMPPLTTEEPTPKPSQEGKGSSDLARARTSPNRPGGHEPRARQKTTSPPLEGLGVGSLNNHRTPP
jgi:very-short-patch-repair endonuclease